MYNIILFMIFLFRNDKPAVCVFIEHLQDDSHDMCIPKNVTCTSKSTRYTPCTRGIGRKYKMPGNIGALRNVNVSQALGSLAPHRNCSAYKIFKIYINL